MAQSVKKRLLLYNVGIVTMDAQLRVFNKGAVLVENDIIADLGASDNLLNTYGGDEVDKLDLCGRWLIPGLVNTHVHTSQQLGRGIADDVDLLTWLHERIWPYEAAMCHEDSYLSTLLCGIELIHSGVTCFAEAGGQHVAAMARAVEELGAQEELYDRFHGTAGGRIRCWFGLRQILNSSDALLTRTRDAARQRNTGIHMHVAEIPYENAHVVSTRGIRHGTVSHLHNLGMLSPALLAAHSVWVDQAEVDMMGRAGVSVSHCASSAMRMLGFAPVHAMLAAGVNVSIGTDGAPSNNRMSLVDEMYVVALINKGKMAYETGVTDPTALPAHTVLQMATINGARACMWDREIGSLEVGKKADLVVVNPGLFTMQPVHDIVGSLVYSMRSENVEAVMCDGRWLMRDGRILVLNEAAVIAKATEAAKELLKRANITVPQRMLHVN
eukprot:jgi/Mesen1/3831/ME000207S02844